MSVRDEAIYLEDMLAATLSVARYMSGRTRLELENDAMLRDAVVRQLEVLGEAATHVSEATRGQWPEVPWRGIIGMRNVLIHAYHRVDVAEAWGGVERELPALRPVLERVCASVRAG